MERTFERLSGLQIQSFYSIEKIAEYNYDCSIKRS